MSGVIYFDHGIHKKGSNLNVYVWYITSIKNYELYDLNQGKKTPRIFKVYINTNLYKEIQIYEEKA